MTVHIFHWKDYDNDRGKAIDSFQDWRMDVPSSHGYVAFNNQHRLMKYNNITPDMANDLAVRYQFELEPDGFQEKITT